MGRSLEFHQNDKENIKPEANFHPHKMTLKRALQTTTTSDSSPTKKIKLKSKLNTLRSAFKVKQKCIKNQFQSIRRKNNKIKKMSTILKDLHNKNFLSTTEFENIQEQWSTSGQLIKRFLVKSKGNKAEKQYPAALKSFAMTLHFYSPKAYDYVRKEFNLCLPNPRTLSKWYMSIEANPGFTTESFNLLNKAVANLKLQNKSIIANLVFDEMAIKKKIEWSLNKDELGYVYDFDQEDYNATPAREVLVFLLVAVNSSWKLPMGYFPIDGIKAEQKYNLTKLCIEKILSAGVDLIGITFDGCPTNLTMAKMFIGDEMKAPFFKHTFHLKDSQYSDKILTITIDTCHAIKLVRNALANKRVILDADNGSIEWSYLEKLVELQEQEQLHLGNKLKKAHIDFKSQIMKVRLATQLMSNSVADALEYCRDGLKLNDFKNCGPTVKFLKIMNRAFDILNSHNISNKGYKKALCQSNYNTIQDSANECIEYISKLQFKANRGTELAINSSRKTGFIGFIMGLKSVKTLYEMYIQPKKLLFVPFYKMSQDHLELFFCTTRSRLGYNNNPTVRQFKSTYQRILSHCQISDRGIGNCLPIEEISILNATSTVETINASVPMRHLIDNDESTNQVTPSTSMEAIEEEFLADHDYLFDPTALTEYTKNVVEYIGGFIVRHLNKKMRCETCLSILTRNAEKYNSLIYFKNRGGLVIPSKDVTLICENTEKEIRALLSSCNDRIKLVSRSSFLKISINVQTKLMSKKLFSDCETHEHFSLLPKAIIETYLHIRFFYITRTFNAQISQRSKLTHLILFQNM